jgi:hypothetical protein
MSQEPNKPGYIVREFKSEPNYEQRMKEIMDAQAEQNRQEETPAERQAKSAVQSAEQHLERVKTAKYANGQPMYTWEQRREAEADLKEKQANENKVSNEAARARYLGKLEAEKKAQGEARAARETERAKAYEAETKESYRAAWQGLPADFEKAWPSMWQNHLVREAEQTAARGRAEMMGRYGGKF